MNLLEAIKEMKKVSVDEAEEIYEQYLQQFINDPILYEKAEKQIDRYIADPTEQTLKTLKSEALVEYMKELDHQCYLILLVDGLVD